MKTTRKRRRHLARQQQRRFAFFSERAKQVVGSVIYRTRDGKEIECTSVAKSMQWMLDNYKWSDKQYVGKVCCFVRRLSHGENPCRSTASHIMWGAMVVPRRSLARITTV